MASQDPINEHSDEKEKAKLKRKTWKFEYASFSTSEGVQEDFLKLRAGKNNEKPPLAEKTDGILIDETNHIIYLYLTFQLEYKNVKSYPFICAGTLEPWDIQSKTFDKNKEDHPDFKSFDFRSYHRQKKLGMQRVDQILHQSIKNDTFSELSWHQKKTSRKSDFKLSRALKSEQQQDFEDEDVSSTNKKVSEEVAKKSEDILADLYARIYQKRSFSDLFQEYGDKGEGRMLKIMAENQEALQKYEVFCKNFQTKTAPSDQLHISTESGSEEIPNKKPLKKKTQKVLNKNQPTKTQAATNQTLKEETRKEEDLDSVPFKFKNSADFLQYQKSKSDYQTYIEDYLPNKSQKKNGRLRKKAEELEKKGWNYYLVNDYAHRGIILTEIETKIMNQPVASSDPEVLDFIQSIKHKVKSVTAYWQNRRPVTK